MKDTQENYDVSKFERPSVTVDVLFFSVIDKKLQVLLIKRSAWPYEGDWALPGGFVKMDEDLDTAAKREIMEECGVKDLFLEQLYTFGNPKRDPRTRVITVAYYALSPAVEISNVQKDEVSEARFYPVDALPNMAFDHKDIIRLGYDRLKSKIGYSNIVYGLLPEYFTLSSLQNIYEAIYGHVIDKRNFRKWMLSSGLIKASSKKLLGEAHRPATLYRFVQRDITFLN